MPRPSNQHLLWMFAGADGVCVKSLDNQVKGRRPDDIEIPVNTGGAPHFVRSSIHLG